MLKYTKGVIMEFSELEISCKTSGWDYSGGRSNNVWGQVPTSHLPIDEINRAIEQGQKSCIWTCYDNAFYSKTKNGKPVTLEELPRTISATFKPTYAKFSAVAENLGMRIAITLGMPTSYNYIVSFDPNKHKHIVNHLNERDLKNLQKYGI